MIKKVCDMYKYAKENNLLLLSNYDALFWKDYRDNHNKYDKLFNRMFNSFFYFMQKKEDTLEFVTTDFIDEVYNHLMINHKKYEELYRIYVIQDNDNPLIDNYKITETLGKNSSENSTNKYGERLDETDVTKGARTDNGSENLGSRVDNVQNVKGSQSDTHEKEVSPFDTENYYNEEKNSDIFGSRTDTSQLTTGMQNNINSFTEGAQTTNKDFTKGEQTDVLATVKAENYTLSKSGRTGNKSIAELLNNHKEFWNEYEFYTYIFKEICAELLLI